MEGGRGLRPRRFLGFLGFTAHGAEGCGIAAFGSDEFYNSASRNGNHITPPVSCGNAPLGGKSALCLPLISYPMNSISVNQPPSVAISYPAAPDFPLKGKRLTTFCASLTLLQNVFAVHPRESVSLGSQVALLPYEPSLLSTLKKGQNTPLYAFLQNHVPHVWRQWNRPRRRHMYSSPSGDTTTLGPKAR